MRMLPLMLAIGLGLVPATAAAQPYAWDAAGVAGMFAGRRPAEDGRRYDQDWFQAVLGGAVLGRHLSPHVKLEVEATATTTGTQFRSTQIEIPGSPYPYWITSEQRTAVRSLAAVAVWQFRDNEWVHPFVAAGISADVDRTVVHTPEQFFYGDPRDGLPFRVAAATTDRSTTTRAGAVVAGGAKVYFRERAFVRTEARLSVAPSRLNVTLRGGVGFDF